MENLFIEHFLSYEDFRSNKEIQALELNEEDLKAIYQVIDQNRFLLCSEHYLPILFHYEQSHLKYQNQSHLSQDLHDDLYEPL